MSSGNSQPAGSARVLVADDEALVRGVLVDILTESGFDVVGQAGDGIEALDLARELQPDLVLLDIKMPRLDGIACASRLREEQPAVRAVILSAEWDEAYRSQAAAAGAVAFVAKGAPFGEIVAALRAALDRRI